MGRWGRGWQVQSLLLAAVLAGLLFLLLSLTGGGEELSEARWLKRRLTKGEPSGEESLGPARVITGEELTGKDIKISVTLASRTKRMNVSSERQLAERLDMYRARKKRISSTCKKYGLGRFSKSASLTESTELYRRMYDSFPWPPEKSLMYQEPWHLLYCWIHKVASSSWSKVFFNLSGKQVSPGRLHEATQQFAPTNSMLPTAISTSLVFTIVRHPFERLVSAYRDKFELARKYAYVYSMYASKILGSGATGRPSFTQFVDYLLREPVARYNDHWVPYWLHCHMCDLEYDIIGHMSSLTQDMNFIAETSGLSSTNMTLPWANKRSSGQQTSLDYFQQLDLPRLQGLYNIYRLDFEMFGYSAQPYFTLFGEEGP